ncbi:type VI secretion system tip protein TssI/VgrG [Sorangium sp. So ce260]|uniref:type VI secretion system Vgr family protein n=1 Tax=Sorangium sp. So ce260 TaxID=3133291 RepID=UPI003F64580D
MENRSLSVLFHAGPLASPHVVGFRLERRLGQIIVAEIEVRSAAYVEPDDLLGSPARLAFGRDQVEHDLSGVVMSVAMVASPEDGSRSELVYRLRVTSMLGLLERQVDCRIFQGMDVKEIVSAVLRDHGIGEERQSWHLVASYPKREYCVQYNESALAFVSRLLEEEGIYFFSDTSDDGEVVAFEDDSTMSDPLQGDQRLSYRYGAGLEGSEDAVGVITQRHRTATGKVTLRDYDFKKPNVDLTVTATADRDADLESYDYPGLYTKASEGARLAEVRLQALQVGRVTLELEAGCLRLTPGRWIELSETPNALDGAYFITGTVHELTMGVYRVLATVIPKAVKYRTPQRTPTPRIDGPQTAQVVAPPGSPAEEIHTDAHGRCKVRFHWDRYGKQDDSASCWIRIAQPQTSGSMVLPRVGWEVIVEFLEGNPDRPIVTGRVFNGRFMPPYALPEGKSRTAIKTASSPGGGGVSEIRMEDKAGSEEIKIQAQKDTTIATGNNKTKSTGANETKNVKVNAELTVGGDQTIKVTNGYKNTVVTAQDVSVGGNRTVEVNAVYGLTSAGASETSVGGNQMEMDGDPIQALLSLAEQAVVAAAKAEAARALQQLDQAVSSKVSQLMGAVGGLQGTAGQIGASMDAVSRGNLGAASGALSAASRLPTPTAFGASLAGAGGGLSAGQTANLQVGLNSLVRSALDRGNAALGEALGLEGAGGGGASLANTAGPDGSVAGNSASESATGPGHAINVCSSTQHEEVGSIKATIAAAGIHTTIKGARTQEIGAARVELVGGTRAESCLADKTEKAVGLVVLSKGPETEDVVGGSRSTMVGGAILEKIGGSSTVLATGKAMFVGAFHKVDASNAIVLKCGESEVVIDGGGIAIKAAAVTITAPNVTLTKAVSEA